MVFGAFYTRKKVPLPFGHLMDKNSGLETAGTLFSLFVATNIQVVIYQGYTKRHVP